MNTASLTEAWKRLREGLLRDHPDIDPETLTDTLDGMTGALDLAADLIRSSQEDKAEALGLAEYIAALTKRHERINHRSGKRKAAAKVLMQEVGVKRISRPDFTATVSAGSRAVKIVDEASLPEWAWNHPPPTVDKKAIRDRLLANEEVPGAVLSNAEPHLTIRA